MFASLLRLGAIIVTPLLLAGTASAQYDAPQDEAALILFSGENYSGEAVNVFDPIYALPEIGFNDRTRSVAVLSGAWEICQHSDFTGRCVLLREDVPDLRYFDLDGEISSVRPIYEYTDAAHGLMFVRDSSGYIRYADEARYGQDDYDYGYGRSSRIEVYHYGYSPAYRSYGYYDPLAGYGPYGFGYSRGGYNTYRAYHRERPPLRGHYGARDADATLYVDSKGRGASLGINRGVKDLSRFRFNDNVSSLNIRSGKWEVCEHANFKGRCEIIDASTGRLNGLRLNDNISSIRPVDGNRDRDRDLGDRGRRGDNGRQDGPRAGNDRRDRGGRGQGDGRQGRNGDVLAGEPAAMTSVPVAPRATGQRRAAPSADPRDTIDTSVRQRRIEMPDRDLARGTRTGRDAARATGTDTPRVRPAAQEPRRSETRQDRPRAETRRAQPPQQQVQTRQRALPQTPAMKSRAPMRQRVQDAPPARAPVQSAPSARAPVSAAPARGPVAVAPAPRHQPRANPRPQRSEQDRMPSPQKGRVGNNQN
jgi:hypothetical protein